VIAVVYGTTGELIKLAPVLRQLQERRAPLLTLCTGQQVEQIPSLLNELELPQPDIWLGHGAHGNDLERPGDIPRWLAQVAVGFVRVRGMVRRRLMAGDSRPLVVVHGDTFTTVLGALMGRSMGVAVAHIEAGMRSGDWRNPFPEELDRIAAARLARIHFAPGAHAVANLRGMKARGDIVDTGANTIFDALDLVPADSKTIELPGEAFGLVSLHRSELLENRAALSEILTALRDASRQTLILLVDHPVTVAAIKKHGLDSLFDERFRHVPRQRYFSFIALLKASSFLVTDSGGSQQECAQLGHPCLVHRAVTEHPEGLDGCVVLSRMDLGVVREFLRDPAARRAKPAGDRTRPTDVIADYLARNGFLDASATAPAMAVEAG
jgi:UDP-N-acetylglucosamine 2-epimerase (non-hydrolysing)